MRITVPLARLRQHFILSSLNAVLALIFLVMAFVWDQALWLAPLALLALSVCLVYAVWCGNMLYDTRAQRRQPS